ncbi:MAG TPA: metalloregulator ArsR/SmtB family transcription factor [Chloroflexota bacterium]|nr:metalloregulator ArsR/SmtB family transcription factor [Chloroflexota bacterium]
MPGVTAVSLDRFGADDAFQGDVCDIDSINPRAVATARESMIRDDQAAGLAEIFGVLGDPTRIKMISALMGSELCVCDLAALLGISQSAVSHQLRLLRAMRLVKFRREGRIVYYSLGDSHIGNLFLQGLEHSTEKR